MCATCGCSEHGSALLTDPVTRRTFSLEGLAPAREGGHHHHHPDDVPHHHAHGDADSVSLEAAVLGRNDALAEQNRQWFAEHGVLAVNLLSSPGSGKTTLLERTLRAIAADVPVSVVEGDQATLHDAERIRATGCPVLQINTGAGCHLDAAMVARAVRELAPAPGSLLMIENVGNLVCPALFDLGEAARVVLLSVTEGDDKPLKYPYMFRTADVLIITKMDLLPHVDFDVDACIEYARRLNPALTVLELSSRTGSGFELWLHWLEQIGRGRRRGATS